MTRECQQILERLGQPLEPALAAHLVACEHCRAVAAAHAALSRTRPPQVPDNGSSALVRSLLEEASRPARPWWWKGLVAVALNVLVVAAGIWMLRSGATIGNLAPPATLWTIAFLLGLLALAGPILALAPGRRSARAWVLASLPLLGLAVGFGGSGLQPAHDWMSAGLGCLFAEVMLSLAPAIFLVWALTGSAFQVRRAAIAGSSAGAVGAFALHLHCKIGTASHLLFFHVLPWLALVAAAVAVRSRLGSRSFAP